MITTERDISRPEFPGHILLPGHLLTMPWPTADERNSPCPHNRTLLLSLTHALPGLLSKLESNG